MADKLTPQQALAVTDRGGRLLVSAAAGSGKTKVLVDRLLSYLLDPQDPANIDDFLIITYTKAAAAELRGKIAAKLTEKLAGMPENRHLQRQMQRLYLAKISTVHAFCGDILREYAYRLDISPDFRVGDENECRALRETAMARTLEGAYENIQSDPDFRTFLDTQGLGRDDRLVPDILLKVYDSAQCHKSPEGWLEACIQNGDTAQLCDAAQTPWGRYLMEDLQAYLDLQIEAMERCASLARQAQEMEKPAALLENTVQQLKVLRGCVTWDAVVANQQIDYGRLLFSKKCTDQDLIDRIKAVREACKKGLEKKLRSFASPSASIFADMHQSASAVRGMAALVRSFRKEYDRLKKLRRVLDFADLEHQMLKLLGADAEQPTALAYEIGSRFREIMVDEYQDSNGVQDAIFSALTRKKQNCFMVGDVKQSIYQFRLADPQIFIDKYNSYENAGQAQPFEGRKVLLSANFRSGGAVLSAVNDIFFQCMSPKVGGLVYGPEEALREGVPHMPLGEPEVELLTVPVEQSTYGEEPAVVAQRISELLDGSHFVRQGEALRPIRPEDIAILLRSPGSVGGHFIRALEERGIRCVSGGGEDLLQTQEIGVLRSLLQVICNPRQDIPLIAALASPVFGFTADDLAALRSESRLGCVYDSLKRSESEKVKAFLEQLGRWRKTASMAGVTRLMEQIFAQTNMGGIYAAMPGGQLRRENLQSFYALAVEFEAAGRQELGQFLDQIEAMEAKGLIAAGEQSAAGAVTMMSIHKSKGLEFPVVFVCGLSREFNRESVRAQVLCHRDLGLGLTAFDEEKRVRFPTVAKRAIAVKTVEDSLSEELRVLYVALTRARDRLIMTYASGNLEGDIRNLALRMDMGSEQLLTQDVVCPGQWVLMAALRRTEAGELFRLGGRPAYTAASTDPWKIRVVTATQGSGMQQKPQEQAALPEQVLERIRRGLNFTYGHTAAVHAPSKQTATQRKGREKDAEAAENTREPKDIYRSWRRPSFVEAPADGVDYGNAMHAFMQYARFDSCGDSSCVAGEIRRMVEAGLLTEKQGQLVNPEHIARFFRTELAQKLACGQVLREFKFSILDGGENFDSALLGEKILLQGVVDCALIEEDGITVVDFKTDQLTEETLPEKVLHYRPQVLAYASAMERIYEKPVKQALLYFFQTGRFVPVTE